MSTPVVPSARAERDEVTHPLPKVGLEWPMIPPPAALYVERDDRLRLRTWSALASTVVEVRTRWQDVQGEVHSGLNFAAANSDRSVAQASFDLGEGYLLGLAATVSGSTPRRGQLFVQVDLVRGGQLADQPSQVLVSGYVTTGQLLGWPGGRHVDSVDGAGLFRSVTGTDPAAGAEISETVPTNARWALRSVRYTFVTDATVATRRSNLIIDDGANILLQWDSADTQLASLTRNYNVLGWGFQPAGVGNELYLPVPTPVPLFQGFRIRTSTDSLQAGDNYGAPQLLVEEWIEE